MTELMFGSFNEAPDDTKRRVPEAVKLCWTCPVREDCLHDAVVTNYLRDSGGIAGGIVWPVRGAPHGGWTMAVMYDCLCTKCAARRVREAEKKHRCVCNRCVGKRTALTEKRRRGAA